MKEGSIRKKGNSLELRVRIGGKQYSFYGKTESEARRKLREFKKQADIEKSRKEYSEEIFYNYIENWLLTNKFGKIKDSSYDILERVYNNQIKNSELAQKKLKDITIDDVQFFVNDIASKYSESILKKTIEIISPTIRRAVAEEKIRFNPLDFISMPKKHTIIGIDPGENTCKVYTKDEIEKITKACMGYYGTSTRNTNRYRYAPAYVLLLNTGMRIGELAALTWNDVDFSRKLIKINKTVSTIKNRGRFDSDNVKVNVITTSKTKKSNRVIPMNEPSCKILLELKKRQNEMEINTNYVVSTKSGDPMLVRVFEQTFSRICKENNIQYKGVHALRHTFGSVMLQNGTDIKIISDVLGHSTVQFTYDRYIHILNEMKAEAMELSPVSDISKFIG